jgi:phenylpropionate dioxygenase-like ring-hydroxylating dioxygenase large terminal subunit
VTEIAAHLRRHWLVACTLRELRLSPLAVTVMGTPLVIYRSGDSIVAAEDRCPHRNAPLSAGTVQDDCIRCPYHGWQFNGVGQCVAAPGISKTKLPNVALRRWQVQIADGLVWVASPDTPSDRRPYQRTLDSAYGGFTLAADLVAELADAIENLLDGTHTPFVHSGLVRGDTNQQCFTAIVHRFDRCVEAEYRGEPGQNGLISRLFEPPREVSFGRYVPPFSAELEYRSAKRIELFVVSHFTPTTPGRVKVFASCYLPPSRLPNAIRFAIARPFFKRVLNQDRRILRLQQENITRFGAPAYMHWSADLLRPWIDAWLAQEVFPPQPLGPHQVQFEL